MSSGVIKRETRADTYVFSYPEAVNEVELAIYSGRRIGDREVVAIIDVLNKNGINMSAETTGLYHSTALQAMFRYVPRLEAHEVNHVGTLKFPSPAVKLSVRLVDWKTKAKIPPAESIRLISGYRSYLSDDSNLERSCVIFATIGENDG